MPRDVGLAIKKPLFLLNRSLLQTVPVAHDSNPKCNDRLYLKVESKLSSYLGTEWYDGMVDVLYVCMVL